MKKYLPTFREIKCIFLRSKHCQIARPRRRRFYVSRKW